MSSGRDASQREPADPLLGTLLKDTYRITRQLAVGGMGAIYQAEHVRLHRQVAVKIVLPHPEGGQLYQRFLAEVEAIAQFGHPHIVQVVDFDRMTTGEPYLVMEYLEGETLETLLGRVGRLPVQAALSITSQAAAALAEVHQRGIVHRDLKPANMFLVHAAGEQYFVKLIDFGISQSTGRRRLTGIHQVVGTPEYMAPEQAQSRSQDHRVDQFALAAITYEMLTGRQAFIGDDIPSVLYQVFNADPPSASSLSPWVPDVVDGVVARALSKNPSHRYPTISQFAFELESAAARAGIHPEAPRSHASSTDEESGEVDVSATRREELEQEVIAPRPEAPTTPSASPPPTHRVTAPLGSLPGAMTAEALFTGLQEAVSEGEYVRAVREAEGLLDLATRGHDPNALKIVERAMPLIDEVFRRYVGPSGGRIEAGPAYASLRDMELTPRAAELLALMDEPTTVMDVLWASQIPERVGYRLLAGLISREVVQRASS